MTDIKLLKNKIIFDGHSNTREECETITLMCDNLAKSKDFKTVKYENGYAEFERISGSKELKFAPSIATLTINFDSYISKVVATEQDLEWTSSGQTNNVSVSTTGGANNWTFTVTLADGYVIDTVTPNDNGETTARISNITTTTFISDMSVGGDTSMELTITSKLAPYRFKHYTSPENSKLPKVIDGTVTNITKGDLVGITTIRPSAFQYCSSLTSIELPDSVVSISDSAFQYCSSLTSLVIPNSVITIGEQFCMNCSKLTNVVLGTGISQIPARAFASTIKLIDITVPANITSIRSYGLMIGDASNKATIHMLSSMPPTISSTAFVADYLNKIIVPKGTATTYKNATNWSRFADYIEEEKTSFTVTLTSKTGDEYGPSGGLNGYINEIDGDMFYINLSDSKNTANTFESGENSLILDNVKKIIFNEYESYLVLRYTLNGVTTEWARYEELVINITQDSTLELITTALD